MRIKSNIFSLFLVLLYFTLASCSGKEKYSHYCHIENGKWHRDSTLVFAIDSLDLSSGNMYDATVELTINRGYPYRDLWIVVNQNLTDSISHADTIRYLLADQHGKWMGSGVGGLNQYSFPYLSFAPRDSVYNYRLTIHHAMEDEVLRGVEKVGIKLVDPQANGF